MCTASPCIVMREPAKPQGGWGGIRTTPVIPEKKQASEDTSADFDASVAAGLPQGADALPLDVLRLAERLAAVPPEVRTMLAKLFSPPPVRAEPAKRQPES